MTTVFIILLIISQLICFYFIILLNSKVAKFKELEVRQNQLISEMDDAIAAYLIEMREENDRLIKELSKIESGKESKVEQKESEIKELEPVSKELDIKIEQSKIVPKNIAVNAYTKQATKSKESTTEQQKETVQKSESTDQKETTITNDSFEEKVINLYNQGKSIEEIAKETEKGKTEIELLLKFHT